MSKRDIHRVLRALTARVDSAAPSAPREWARQELAVLRAAVDSSVTPRRAPRVTWTADALAHDARVTRIMPNGLGGVDTTTGVFVGIKAQEHSFDDGRHGIPADAATLQVLPTASWGGSSATLVVEPLLSTQGARADSGRWAPALHRAYMRVVAHNLAVRVGPDEQQWGQSPSGAMFISGSAAPLPAITIGTDTPVTLPWLLKYVGPFRLTALLADLGAGYPSHAKLAAWQGSIHPWSNLELGVAVVTHTGGSGAPPATLVERVVDLFPVIDALAPQHADLQISNKIAGGNLRIRFPQLSGLDLYYELAIDDFDGRRLRSSLVEDSGHLLGFHLPLLVGGTSLVWRGEFQRTSLRLYEHGQFISGYTFHERLIGNPLGPNAKAAVLSVRWIPSRRTTFQLDAVVERRNPSIFSTAISGSADRGFRFVLDSLRSDVRRDRVSAAFDRDLGRMAARVAVGAALMGEQGPARRGEWFVELGLRRDFLRTF